MADIEAILTKPLDGDPIGTKRTFSEQDFNTMKGKDAVKAAPSTATDGKKPDDKKSAKAV